MIYYLGRHSLIVSRAWRFWVCRKMWWLELYLISVYINVCQLLLWWDYHLKILKFRLPGCRLTEEPAAYGKLGLANLLELREECLREFHFFDPYRSIKLRLLQFIHASRWQVVVIRNRWDWRSANSYCKLAWMVFFSLSRLNFMEWHVMWSWVVCFQGEWSVIGCLAWFAIGTRWHASGLLWTFHFVFWASFRRCDFLGLKF
jgi:hypothetical protein